MTRGREDTEAEVRKLLRRFTRGRKPRNRRDTLRYWDLPDPLPTAPEDPDELSEMNDRHRAVAELRPGWSPLEELCWDLRSTGHFGPRWPIRKLADALGVPKSTIGRWELQQREAIAREGSPRQALWRELFACAIPAELEPENGTNRIIRHSRRTIRQLAEMTGQPRTTIADIEKRQHKQIKAFFRSNRKNGAPEETTTGAAHAAKVGKPNLSSRGTELHAPRGRSRHMNVTLGNDDKRAWAEDRHRVTFGPELSLKIDHLVQAEEQLELWIRERTPEAA